MQPKTVAIRVTNQQEFDTVIEHMIECGYDTVPCGNPMDTWQFNMYGDTGTKVIEFKENPNVFFDGTLLTDVYLNHDIVSFATFCTIAGIKPKGPKEVILNWPGRTVNVSITIKKTGIDVCFDSTMFRKWIINSHEMIELATAINSLRNE